MSFAVGFRDELHKTAVMAGGMAVRRGDQRQLVNAALRQGGLVRGLKALAYRVGGADAVRQLRKIVHEEFAGNIGGTLEPARRGRPARLWVAQETISRPAQERMRRDVGIGLRGVVAHEAFHAATPVLGKSEILAHAYGGWHDRRRASTAQRLGRGFQQIGHLARSRPSRFAIEAALAAGVGYGAYRAAKALRKRLRKDDTSAQERST